MKTKGEVHGLVQMMSYLVTTFYHQLHNVLIGEEEWRMSQGFDYELQGEGDRECSERRAYISPVGWPESSSINIRFKYFGGMWTPVSGIFAAYHLQFRDGPVASFFFEVECVGSSLRWKAINSNEEVFIAALNATPAIGIRK